MVSEASGTGRGTREPASGARREREMEGFEGSGEIVDKILPG
jgi:hypothetical protein